MTGLLQPPLSTKRILARETRPVVISARDARKALLAVVKLAERRQRETLDVGEEGLAVTGWVQMSDGERVESLHQAMLWLQRAEAEVRHVRLALERAIDRAERRMF